MNRAVVFDIGGVLVELDYRGPCRGLFADEAETDSFLADVLGHAFHLERDIGVPMAETTARWCELHPAHAEQIRAFSERLTELWTGPMPGAEALLGELEDGGVPMFGLSNWGYESWPWACRQFPFLDRLDGVLISAEVGVAKPDPAIYESFCARFGVAPSEAVFVDDIRENVEAARALGFHGIVFTSVAELRVQLVEVGLLASTVSPGAPP